MRVGSFLSYLNHSIFEKNNKRNEKILIIAQLKIFCYKSIFFSNIYKHEIHIKNMFFFAILRQNIKKLLHFLFIAYFEIIIIKLLFSEEKMSTKSFIFLLFFISPLLSQQIFSQPSVLTFQNAGLCSQIVLPILLETPLLASEWIYLKSPFSLGSSQSPTFSLNDIPLAVTKVNENEYFLQISTALSSNLWYNFTIFIKDSSTQTSGLQGCLLMKTMSSMTNGFVYDYSPCIDQIAFAGVVVSDGFTVQASTASSDSSKKNTFGASYRGYFDITPHMELDKGGIFSFSYDNADFGFDYPCINTICTADATDCITDIPALNSSNKCVIENGNKAIFSVNGPITKNTFRVAINIKNPNFYLNSAAQIKVMFRSSAADFVYGVATVTGTLSLLTAYPVTTITKTVKLFWGLLSRTDTSSDGCPLTLYANADASSLKIFNNIKTEFVLSTNVLSFSRNNYLKVQWHLLEPGSNYIYLQPNSLASNLPVPTSTSASFSYGDNNDMLIISNIDSLDSSTKYYISAKVKLASSAADQTLKCGGVGILTGNDNFIASVLGEQIPIRTNREYIDTTASTGWFASPSDYNFYNFLYSYKASDYNLEINSAGNTLSVVYGKITSAFLQTSSKIGVFAKPTSSVEMHNLFLTLYAPNTKVCMNNFVFPGTSVADTANKCSGSGTANGFHILLKIVFNNNVLGIDSNNFPKGVLPIGTLFSKDDGTNSGVSGYNTESTQGKVLNKIVSTSDSAGGVFQHVSLVCKQANAAVDYCHSILGRSATTVSGLAFVDTNIQTYPDLYVGDYVFDMVLCFKLMKYASFESYAEILEGFFTLYENSANEAGPGVIHGYVLSGGPPTNSFGFLANYYKNGATYGNGNYFASYLRVAITFENDLPATGTNLGVFFMDGASADLQFYASSDSIINCIDTKASVPAVKGQFLEADSPANSQDFWFFHKAVILSSNILSGTSYDFYIPMRVSSNQITSLNVAVMTISTARKIGIYVTKALYKLQGSPYLTSLVRTFSSSNVLSPFTDITSNFNNDNTNGCSTSSIPRLNPGDSSLGPYKTITNMKFLTDIAKIGTGANCPLDLNTGTNNGAIFAIYSRKPLFDYTPVFQWDYAGDSINHCAVHNIYVRSSSSYFYTILCTLDSGSNVPTISSNKNLNIEKFIVPFYWAENYNIADNLQYVWSANSGLGVSMTRDPTVTSSWIQDTCEVLVVQSVPINSKDIYYTLSLKNVVKYTLEPSETLTVTETIAAGGDNLNYIGCFFKVSNLTCAYLGSGVFSLTNPSSTSAYTVGVSAITIYVLIDSPTSFSDTTHTARVSYGGLGTETCSESQPTAFKLNGGTISNTISLSAFKYVNMASARGSFFLTFTLKRNLRKNCVFSFNWGFLSTGFTDAGAYYCNVLDSTNMISHKFSQINSEDLTQQTISLNQDIVGGDTFTIKCNGVQTPTTSEQTSIIVSYKRPSDNLIITDSNTSSINPETINLQRQMAVLSFTKRFINKGFDADYVIMFRPTAADITTSGRIYVEFSQAMAPYLNSLDSMQCLLENVITFCGFSSERRLYIVPNIYLNSSYDGSYSLIITAVLQPNEPDANWKLYFALDTNADPYDGVSEQGYLTETSDSTSLSSFNLIFIEEITLSTNYLLSPLILTVKLTIPANVLIGFSQLFVYFPKSFEESLQITGQITCSLMSVYDESQKELSSYCQKTYGRKIFLLVTDPNNSVVQTYILKISGLISPQNPTLKREDIRVFFSNDNSTITAATASCFRNTSQYLTFYNASSFLIELNFFDSSSNVIDFVEVYKGVYKGKLGIGPNNGNFPYAFDWQFASPQTTNFFTYPKVVTIAIGSKISYFILSCDSSTAVGQYYLQAKKTGTYANKYSDIPALKVRVRDDPCQLKTEQSIYILPYGGRTVPIIIDFSECLPINDVSVTANVSLGYESYYISIENERTKAKTLTFNENNLQTKIIFYAVSYSQNTLTGAPFGTISFWMNGTQAQAYLPPIPIQIQVVDNSKFSQAPTAATPVVNANVGKTTIITSCDQIGTLYYAIGLDNSVKSETWDTIRNKSEESLIKQTFPIKNDKYYKVYGYEIINVENNNINILLENKLKGEGNYEIRVFCLNLANVPSAEAAATQWTQPDNNGKKFKIGIIYKTQLSSAQKVDIACGFSSYFQINPERVLTDEGTYCIPNINTNSSRILQDSNSTNTSNTSTTNDTSSSSSSTTPSSYSYYWYFSKNFTAESDDLFTLASTASSQSTFYNSIIGLTSSGASSFPTLINMTSVVDLSNLTNSTVTPVLQSSMIVSGSDYVAINLTITNVDGYIYIGIANKNSTTPNASQLKKGVDGNNSQLIKWEYSYSVKNQSNSFRLNGLQNKTYYYLYYMANNDDLTEDGTSTSVIARTVFTYAIKLFGVGWIFALFMAIIIINH